MLVARVPGGNAGPGTDWPLFKVQCRVNQPSMTISVVVAAAGRVVVVAAAVSVPRICR